MVTELMRCLGRLKFTCNCSVRFLTASYNSQQVGTTQVFIDGRMYCKNKMCYMKIFISCDLTVCTPFFNSFFSPWFPSQPHQGLSLRTVTVGLYLLVPRPRCRSAHSLESTCPLCKRQLLHTCCLAPPRPPVVGFLSTSSWSASCFYDRDSHMLLLCLIPVKYTIQR